MMDKQNIVCPSWEHRSAVNRKAVLTKATLGGAPRTLGQVKPVTRTVGLQVDTYGSTVAAEEEPYFPCSRLPGSFKGSRYFGPVGKLPALWVKVRQAHRLGI
jgi:hypothetical protein